MSSDDLDANVDFRMLSDALDAADESFFLNAISEEATQAPPPDHEDSLESRDISSTESATNPDTKAHAEPSNAVIEPRKTADGPQDENDPPQAMLIFVMGDHRVSDSCALGVLNEHPEALKAITSNQCLRTSAFLKPALEAAMAELRPSMMMPVAVRLTAISLRLVAGILPNHQTSPQDDNVDEGEQQKLAEIVQHELGQAVPYYQWQGPTNYCGRIQHLMALLEEAIRIMAVPSDLLTAALKLDAAAAHISQQVLRSILDLGQKPEDVCGTWAADTLLSAWILRKARRPPQCLAPDSSRVKENGINLAVSSDSESEEELPSPSKFVQRRPDAKAGRALSPEDKVRAADDQNVKSGSAGKSP